MSSKNILFITLLRIDSINERGIYNDLLRDLQNKGNKIFVVSPLERRLKLNEIYLSDHAPVFVQLELELHEIKNFGHKLISCIVNWSKFLCKKIQLTVAADNCGSKVLVILLS